MSYLSFSPRAFRQFITLLLIYSLALPQVIIAAQRPSYDRPSVSDVSAKPSVGEHSTAGNATTMVPVTTAAAFAGVSLVGWSNWFSSTTADTGIAGNTGVSVLTAPGANPITTSDAYGTGQQWAFTTGWDNGANTKAWRFNFSTLNYNTLNFSCRMAGTNAFFNFMGPRDFKLQYSLNGTTWTDVSGGALQAGIANASSATFSSISTSLPAACENQATVYLQMLMSSNVGANGGSSVVNGGQSHIDDILVTGAALPAPTTLGNYPNATVTDGNSTTSTPSAAPANLTSATAYTSSNFQGLFSVNPTTGVVRVTNAQPAGTYTVTVAAFGAGGTTTKTFTLTVSNPSACTTTGFSGTTNVAVGSTPVSVTTGDFNGDGKLDLAAANSSNNNVSIRLGDGAGGFSGATNVPVGSSPYSVSSGDFNNDGKLDFATANNLSGANSVSIRLGDGAGGFSGTTDVAVGTSPISVSTGDFNGDSKLDFATANFASNTVSIRLGDGLGGFSGSTEVAVGTQPVSVTTGDFNSDGKLDFAVANYASNTVSIRLGDGLGGFSGSTNVTVGSKPSATTGDFNGDGKLDFATANEGSNTVSIRLGDGLGGFSGSTEVAVGSFSNPYSVTTGDFNGDGKPDFATANSGNNNVPIRLGNGAGGFSGTTDVTVGSSPYSVTTGDFNGDGKLDFATANANSGTVSIRLNSCTNNTAPTITAGSALARTAGSAASNASVATVNDTETAVGSLTVTATTIPTGISVSNIVNTNGTITADVAAGCTATVGANTVVFTVTDGGALTATANLTVNVAANTAPTLSYSAQSAAVGNAATINPAAAPGDNGSISSFAVQSVTPAPASGTITVSNAGVASVPNNLSAGSYTVTIRATDNCGLFTDASFALTVAALPTLGNYPNATVTDGNSTTSTPSVAPTGTTSATAYTSSTFKGLFSVDPTTGVVRVTNAQPAGSYTVTVAAFGAGGTATKTFTLTVNNPFACTTTGFSGTTNVAVGTNPTSVTTGDFNGDGNLDFATANYNSSTVSIRLGDGLGGFSGSTNVAVGSAPYSVTTGDFNGDGKLDFAAANFDSGTVFIRLGDGAGGFSGTTEVTVGSTPISVTTGDFNGDGKLDFATANRNSNTVSIRLNSCTNNTAPTITAGSALARIAGGAAGNATIATVNDTETAAGSLTVTATTVPTGITVTNIANNNGAITANVAAGCSATVGANTVVFTVTDGGALTATANLTVNVAGSPVSIETPPASQTVNIGSSVTFSVIASNAVGFQWRKGEQPISTATGSSYTINAAALADAGSYDVVVTGLCGNVTSTAATLTVNKLASTTTVASSANPSSFGQSVNLSTTVTGTSPTGTITFKDGSTTLGTAALSGGSASLSTSSLSVGSHNITAEYGGDGTHLSSSSSVLSQTVNQASLTITWNNPANITYGTALSATQLNATAGVAGSFSYSPALGTALGAGTHTLNTTFTPTDTANYQSANSRVTIVVEKAPLTVTADAQSRDYGAANPTLTYQVAGFVNGDTASVLSGTPSVTTLATPASGVDGYAISAAAGTLAASNYQFSFVPANLTVNKATLTVTADAKSRDYGAANPALTATYSGFVNGDTAAVVSGSPTLSTTATATSSIGDYPISAAAGTLSASNYLFSFVPGTLSVNQATLTVTTDAKSRNYGEANPTLTYQVTGFSNGDTESVLTGSPSLTTTATNTSGVGSYPITAALGTLAAANYKLAFVNNTLTVNQAILTVTTDAKSRNYGEANPTLTYQVTGFSNGDTASILSGTPSLTTTATNASGIGDYPISAAAGTLTASNYQFSFVPSTLTVNKATLTVTAEAKARDYGVANPTLTAIYSGFVNSDTSTVVSGSPTLSTTATTASNIGSYPITAAAGTLAANNYLFSFADGTLAVNKATLTVAAENKSRGYGTANPVLTGQISGIQNNDNLTASYATTATQGSAAGTYPITPTLNDPNSKGGNYDVQLTNGALTVGKATLTFTAEDMNRTYGSGNPVLSYQISGFSNGESATVLSGTPQLSTTATSSSNVGNYPINIGAGSLVAANYDLAFVPGKLTVTHASLTVTAESQTRPYGTANPQLSVSFSGFVNGDSMNLTSGGAEVYTTALPNSPAGTYPIYVNGVTNPNYSINYVRGTLTVTSVKPTLNLTTNLAPSALGQLVSITASARPSTQFGGTPSGTVLFTLDGKQLSPFILNAAGQATYSSSDLTVGSHTITASYNGDNNYQAGTKELAQEVSKASSATTLTSNANPASTGQRIILTAKVKGSASQPTGSIEFFDGTKSLGIATLKDGVASLALTELPEGSHALTAVYAGDNVSDRSVSSVLTQQVTSECVYSLSQKEIVMDATGGSFAITLITRSSCAWNIDNQNSWIEVRSPDIVNGQWVTTFIVSPLTEAKIRVGKLKFANQEIIVTQSRPTTTVQAASYDRQSLAPSTIASIFGTDLSAETVAASSQPLPSDLGGVRVKVRDSKGKEQWVQLLYVSPTQINFLVPSDVAEGELIVTVVRGTVESSAGKFNLEPVAPGLFSADSTGSGPAAAQIQRVAADGTQTFETTASFNRATSKFEYQPIVMNTGTSLISDDVYLVLYGTGMRNRSSLQNVRVRIGGQEGEVLYVGDQFAYPGLDQVNVRLPQSLAGAGLVDIVLSVDGKTANTVKIFIQ